MAEKDTERVIPTLDGKRTRVDQLNLGEASRNNPKGDEQRGGFKGFLQRLNQVLAGMYTGLSCYGTPHSHRRESKDPDKEADKPDKRPL